MKYENIPIDESTGRLLRCLKCENEEIDANAKYCKICGHVVINYCTNENCNAISSGNARYCVSCGSETLFYKNKVLPAWDDIQNFSVKKSITKKETERDTIPNLKEKKEEKVKQSNSNLHIRRPAFKEDNETEEDQSVTFTPITSLDDDDEIPFSRIKID